jgi:putative hydrolase of the HAD superfamily
MIVAILFDLDGTLRLNRPSGLEAFIEFASELGLTLGAEARHAVERWTHAYWSGKHSGFIATLDDPAAFWRAYTQGMLTAAGIEDTDAYTHAIVRAFGERYHAESYIPDEAHTLLRALREDGYTLGLVSNRADDLAAVAADTGLSDYFHFTLSGGQANSWKPDARIFVRACGMANAVPSECVYVGDNFYADAQGAQAAGLVPILLDPRDAFPDVECVRITHLSDLLSVICDQSTRNLVVEQRMTE